VVIRRRDTVTVRLPPDLAARARAEADARGVALPWFVARLVREGLDTLAPGLTLTRPPGPERDPDPERRPKPPPYRPDLGLIGHVEEEQRGPEGG
jgi:hypothetical protein